MSLFRQVISVDKKSKSGRCWKLVWCWREQGCGEDGPPEARVSETSEQKTEGAGAVGRWYGVVWCDGCILEKTHAGRGWDDTAGTPWPGCLFSGVLCRGWPLVVHRGLLKAGRLKHPGLANACQTKSSWMTKGPRTRRGSR